MAWTLAIISICWAIVTTIIVVFFGRAAKLGETRSETKTAYNDEQWEAICTGTDVPNVDTWRRSAEISFWSGTERYQPWKDVAHVFKQYASHD